MKNDNFCVYIHINKINNKKYIGITSKRPEKRWNNGLGYSNNKYFTNSIKKYGWNMFDHEILFTNLTKEEACKLEIKLIKKYNTTDCKFGYNRSTGGECSSYGVVQTKESNLKRSKTLSGHLVNDETKRKISKKIKEWYQNPETKEKTSRAAYKKWENEEYRIKQSNSIKTYFKNNNEAREKISNLHKGKRRSPLTEFKKGENMGKNNARARAIIQYDLNKNFIKNWDCMADVTRELGFDSRNISSCCRNERKTAYGYIWNYA